MLQSGKGNRILRILLLAANAAMIIWIVTAPVKAGKTPVITADTKTDISVREMIPDLPDTEEEPIPETEESETPQPEQTAVPEPAATAELEEQTTPAPVYEEVKRDPEGRRPTFYDFDWYLQDPAFRKIRSAGVPADNLGEILGEWKAFIDYDTENTTGNPCRILFNMIITAEQYGLEADCDWYYYKYKNDAEPTYQNSHSIYKGSWDGRAFTAEGSGTMSINGFRTLNGTQYAYGTMTDRNGIPGVLLMVREKES